MTLKEYELRPGELIGVENNFRAYVEGKNFIRIPKAVAESFQTKHGYHIVDAGNLKVKARKQEGRGNLVGVVESLDFVELT